MTLEGCLPLLLATAGSGTTAGSGNVGGGFWMPPQASTVAAEIDWIFFFIYWICVFFFVLIVILMVLFMVKYRRVHGRPAEGSTTHHTPLELTWTIIPLILVIAIFYVGLKSYIGLVQEPANAYEVYVTGQKWNWTFEHRNGATQAERVVTVPSGRPVKFIITSTDVLHAVFIPSFRVKQDAVPGRYTHIWFEAKEPGDYQLFCAEYCGTDHSQMGATVRALPPGEFEAAIEEAANWIDDVPEEELPKAGLRLHSRCSSCHTLEGTPLIGPSFRETHELWGKTRVFRDGSEAVIDENYVRNSILNPAAQIVDGFTPQMPTFQGQLKDRELTALIEFIKHLDEVVDDSGKPLP